MKWQRWTSVIATIGRLPMCFAQGTTISIGLSYCPPSGTIPAPEPTIGSLAPYYLHITGSIYPSQIFGYINANGYLTDISQAAPFVLTASGELTVGQNRVSIDLQGSLQVFNVSSERGTISTRFSLRDGLLHWESDAFGGGEAAFCVLGYTLLVSITGKFPAPCLPARIRPVLIRSFFEQPATTQSNETIDATRTAPPRSTKTSSLTLVVESSISPTISSPTALLTSATPITSLSTTNDVSSIGSTQSDDDNELSSATQTTSVTSQTTTEISIEITTTTTTPSFSTTSASIVQSNSGSEVASSTTPMSTSISNSNVDVSSGVKSSTIPTTTNILSISPDTSVTTSEGPVTSTTQQSSRTDSVTGSSADVTTIISSVETTTTENAITSTTSPTTVLVLETTTTDGSMTDQGTTINSADITSITSTISDTVVVATTTSADDGSTTTTTTSGLITTDETTTFSTSDSSTTTTTTSVTTTTLTTTTTTILPVTSCATLPLSSPICLAQDRRAINLGEANTCYGVLCSTSLTGTVITANSTVTRSLRACAAYCSLYNTAIPYGCVGVNYLGATVASGENNCLLFTEIMDESETGEGVDSVRLIYPGYPAVVKRDGLAKLWNEAD